MSLRYFILPAILSSTNTKMYSKCKVIMMRNCQLRREFIKQNIDHLNEDQIYALLPEYSLQHLVHWYGYNDEFTSESIEEMSKIIMFMIENVIENNADGISIIQHQLEILKVSNDNLFTSLNLHENEMMLSKMKYKPSFTFKKLYFPLLPVVHLAISTRKTFLRITSLT